MLTLAVFMKLKEVYYKNGIDSRYCNVLYGVGNYMESQGDYYSGNVGYNYNEYHQMMYNGYSMNNVSGMVNPFYNQNDSMYQNMPSNNYNYSHNMMYNYPQNQFMDNTSRKKFETFAGGKSELRK